MKNLLKHLFHGGRYVFYSALLFSAVSVLNSCNISDTNSGVASHTNVYVELEYQHKNGEKQFFRIDGEKIETAEQMQNMLADKTVFIFYRGILWGKVKERLVTVLKDANISTGYVISCYSDNKNNGKIITPIECLIQSE